MKVHKIIQIKLSCMKITVAEIKTLLSGRLGKQKRKLVNLKT